MDEIFLSASVPQPGRQYYGTADPLLIHFAVRAFLTLMLGRRRIVWGGHPSITPMVQAACQSLGLKYTQSVMLYQSEEFRGTYPAENDDFPDVVFTKAQADRTSSLRFMREEMLGRNTLTGAVFIGGMEGVIEEYEIFVKAHPKAPVVTVPRPGGASREVALRCGYDESRDLFPTDFTRLFIEQLGVFPSEPRI
ncbi:hypothetical protein B0G80_3677 [Paraburkholderia sp. BL6669N2]|uniref:SLOG domain-containing protein n=1 Tax=Paraburkholderia sp. BL6669N2 TaxID=1938807 RepID=UPI000E2403CF|nr:hypothetical protein [Paraburkholderia sp. BL6669N2]REG60854.1 hypothetical protein B0G80_3677 [Paraburkholderia sp. BL6669N2]